MGLRQRISAGLAANGLSQIITVGLQLGLLPLLIVCWGGPLYADWVLLSSIPAYIGMFDGGLGAVAGSQMTMQRSAGHIERMHAVANGAYRYITIMMVCVLVAGLALAYFVPWHRVLNLGVLANPSAALVAIALGISTLLGLWGGLFHGILRAEERYATGVMLANATRLAEGLACGIAAWLGYGPVGSALAMMVVKLLAIIVTVISCRGLVGWLPQFGRGAWQDIRALIPAASAQIAMPFSYAMSLQGVVLVIAHTLGAEAAAAFNAMRILTRLITQVSAMIAQSISPELSRLVGVGENLKALVLIWHSALATSCICIASSVFLLFLGHHIFHLWTHDRLIFSYSTWALLLLVAILNSAWGLLAMLPIAINRHARIGWSFALVATATPIFAWVGSKIAGLQGVAAVTLMAELTMFMIVIHWILCWRRASC